MSDSRQIARVLKHVVFGYALDFFPGLLIVGYNQFKRKLARAGYDVAVSMSPLNDLPTDPDILFVPPELAEAARSAAPRSYVEVLDSFLNHPAYNRLIEQLNDGREWTAARLAERPPVDGERQIVRYRGYERIE